MKVIKKGKNNQVKCLSCGSTLEFESTDVARKKVGIDYDDGEDIFSYSIQCSVCKQSVGIINMTHAMRSRVDEIQKNRDLSDYDV